jgi:hypothetical protein
MLFAANRPKKEIYLKKIYINLEQLNISKTEYEELIEVAKLCVK